MFQTRIKEVKTQLVFKATLAEREAVEWLAIETDSTLTDVIKTAIRNYYNQMKGIEE